MKTKMLIGFIMDGKAGGVDKYILSFMQNTSDIYFFDVLSNQNSEELRSKLQEQGIGLFCVPGLSHSIKQYKQIKALIKKNNYDIVYLNTSTALMLPLMLAAWKCKVPVRVVHSHSSGIDVGNKLKRAILLIIHKCGRVILCKAANRFFACSQKAGEWMFSKEFEIIPNAIDVRKYLYNSSTRKKLRQSMGISEEIVLGHISNFQQVKNAHFLIDVLNELHLIDVKVKLLLVGNGPEKASCLEKVKELGIEDRIIDMGYQSEIADFYQVMDFFLLPSHFEGFPIVSVEAQASQVACMFSENIAKEVKMASKTCFLPIDKGAKIWADWIIENFPYKREENNLSEQIKEYDSKRFRDISF